MGVPPGRLQLPGGFFLFHYNRQFRKLRMLYVSEVECYWYVEAGGECYVTETLPWSGIGPTPPRCAIVDANGEVYGEAVLMGALPWPRFRRFLDGKKVVLPFRTAVTLKRFEESQLAVNSEGKCSCGLHHPGDWPSHYRVEVLDTEGFSVAVTRWCDCHFEFFSQKRFLINPVRDKRTVSYADLKGASGRRPQNGADHKT